MIETDPTTNSVHHNTARNTRPNCSYLDQHLRTFDISDEGNGKVYSHAASAVTMCDIGRSPSWAWGPQGQVNDQVKLVLCQVVKSASFISSVPTLLEWPVDRFDLSRIEYAVIQCSVDLKELSKCTHLWHLLNLHVFYCQFLDNLRTRATVEI